MIDATLYNITVRKGIFDGEECFEARIAELPDICEYADNFDGAYQLAIDSIQTTAFLLKEQGKEMPAPFISSDNYTGRLALHLPKSLHRKLAHTAKAEGITLNQYVANVLNFHAGYLQAKSVETR